MDQVLVEHLRTDTDYEEKRRTVPGYLLPHARESYRTVKPEPIQGVSLRTAAVVLRSAKRLAARMAIDRERARARPSPLSRQGSSTSVLGGSAAGGAPALLRKQSSSFIQVDDLPL